MSTATILALWYLSGLVGAVLAYAAWSLEHKGGAFPFRGRTLFGLLLGGLTGPFMLLAAIVWAVAWSLAADEHSNVKPPRWW